MRFTCAFLIATCAVTSVYTSPVAGNVLALARDSIVALSSSRQKSGAFLRRAVAPSTAPSGDYEPSKNQSCPTTLVRQPSNTSSILSNGERDWVASRRANAVSQWSSYLSSSALNFKSSGFDLTSFLSNTSNLPNVAIAASGGGYRSMLHSAALLNAFDARNATSLAQGTGGILQLATYIAGLSGGSWLVGSLAVNDFPTIFDLRNVWNLKQDLVRILHSPNLKKNIC